MGVDYQWAKQCNWVFNVSSCPAPKRDTPYLIDGPQNTYAMLRIINETVDLSYAEFRPPTLMPTRTATNWTECYDNANDFWQKDNLVLSGGLSPQVLDDLSSQLWAVANCTLSSCP